MDQNVTDDGTDSNSERRETAILERYAAIEFDGAAVLIYDEKNEDAWIQSDTWTSR